MKYAQKGIYLKVISIKRQAFLRGYALRWKLLCIGSSLPASN